MHLIWFAPFYSGGGYCTEAQAIVAAYNISQQYFSADTATSNLGFSFSHHGDSVNTDYLSKLSESDKTLYNLYDSSRRIQAIEANNFPIITVCHSEPGAWYGNLRF